jgi:poly(3-hydroxybutyrate) depolymerase
MQKLSIGAHVSPSLSACLLLIALTHPCEAAESAPLAGQCANLPNLMAGHFPDAFTHLTSATVINKGTVKVPGPGHTERSAPVPDHCEVIGTAQEREGADGQHYAIRFHLRLPFEWNGRFFFQGGGGSNGYLGDALGGYSPAAPTALTQGFAVVSQDSGHDNTLNNDPSHGGVLVFGFDETARVNYGHSSLPIVSKAAKAIIKEFYGSPPHHSYFVGCSKGGEEGMVLAQRYPEEFDGIAAGAPGMSLPRAAVEEAWDTQALASIVKPDSSGAISLKLLETAFSDTDLVLVRDSVLSACDKDDGAQDGIVGDFSRCTSKKVLPKLQARRCGTGKTDQCLSDGQISALTRLMTGAHDSKGHSLYSDWPWDAGIASPGWRTWKLGSAGGPPSLNVVLGGPSLASVFTTPPTPLDAEPQRALNFLLQFDFNRDAPKIYATDAQFPTSAWDNISARSTDLSGFRAHGGKLIVTHGVSDPVFSINDTLAWWREVNKRTAGKANTFARVFPVPGMNHCGGGPATDGFDVMPALTQWVEKGQAPGQILANAGPASPWPTRTRPLCAYPAIARYKGSGDIDSADSFECRE